MRQVVQHVVLVLVIVGTFVGCHAATGKNIGHNVDDKSITTAVKARLVAEKASNLTRVNVETNRGTVYLIGAVDTPEQRARVEQIARQQDGVKAVVNQLAVRSSESTARGR